MGQLMRASGTYNLQKTTSRSGLVLCCLPVCLVGPLLWEGTDHVVGRRLGVQRHLHHVWLLFQLRNFFFLF